MEGLSRQVCEAVHALRYEDLPAEVVAGVKRLTIDAVAVLGGAARAPGIAQLNFRLSQWEAAGSCTVLLSRQRCSPPTAALANGAAAHALDFDDLHDTARVHTSCVMLPSLLASAEDAGGVDGKRFILAMAAGAELHARLGLACPGSLARGWHPTMVFGALAGSLAAGKLLGLEPKALGDALGLAFHQASGSAQSMHDGVLAKRLGAGFAARAAVLAAFLAKDGLTGPLRPLEGEAGLFMLYERGEVKPQALMAGWGHDWQAARYSLKPYPGCRCNHTVIALALQLHREAVNPEDVAHIKISLGELNWRTVGQAYEPAQKSVVHAQFNAAYSFARALTDGKFGMSSYDETSMADARIAALTGVTEVVADPSIEACAIAPARAIIELRDGTTLQRSSSTMKGSPEEPMADAELLDKVRDCLAYGLAAKAEDAGRLIEAVRGLEASENAASALLAAFP